MNKFIAILCLLFLVSCSSDSWSSAEKNEFISGCKGEGGGSFYCKCFMRKVMEAYPNYEDADKMSVEEAVELSNECYAED